MKTLLAAALCAVLVFIGYPLAMENTSDPCGAFANRIAAASGPDASKNPIVMSFAKFLGSPAAEMYARQKYPNVPPALSCLGLYWQNLLHPHSGRIDPLALEQGAVGRG